MTREGLLRVRLADLPQDLLLRHVANGEEPAVGRLLAARGLLPEDLPRLADEAAAPPWQDLPGITQIVEEVAEFLRRGGRLAIHGDYDVDGITGAAIAARAVESLGHRPEVFLPHRLRDGYGLKSETVRRLQEGGIGGILTIDCGVSAHAAAQVAAELGVRLWITDHHLQGDVLPEAPMAHPGSLDREHPLRWLSGAGVALQLARAWLGSRSEELLDLAALGTLADQVPLLGENRRIARTGLRRMGEHPRPGIAALLQVARFQGPIDEEAAAFVLAPRLNASGRLDHPDLALHLLQAGLGEAGEIAQRLESLNRQRRTLEQEVSREAMAQVPPGASCVVVHGEGWHRGVIGIVAARLVDEFSLPAFVMSVEGGVAYGSARAPAGAPLLEALTAARGWLAEFGGHPGAAGFHLGAGAVEGLKGALETYYRSHPPVAEPRLVDARLRLGDASLAVVDGLERLRPFGPGQPQPQWLIEDAEVLEDRAIGDGRHRRLRLRDRSGESVALHWRAGEVGVDRVDLVAALEADTFQGERRARLRVVERAPSAMAELRRQAALPPRIVPGPGAAEVLDRRGMGPGEVAGLCHYYTLDGLTVGRSAAAFGEGFYPSADAPEELMALYRSGRLRGVVGPHPVPFLPIQTVVAMERAASPMELRAVASGRRLVLGYRPLDEHSLAQAAAVWAPTDDDLRQAYRQMRLWPAQKLALPPEGPTELVPYLVFRELGLVAPDGMTPHPVRLEDSRLLAAFRQRAQAFAESAGVWYGQFEELCRLLSDAEALGVG